MTTRAERRSRYGAVGHIMVANRPHRSGLKNAVESWNRGALPCHPIHTVSIKRASTHADLFKTQHNSRKWLKTKTRQ